MYRNLLFFIGFLAISSTTLSANIEDEEWFHRTDLELQRVINNDQWELEIAHSSGPDFHKLLIEAELELENGDAEELDTGLYYGHPFGRYGLWKVGVNYRSDPGNDFRLLAGLEYELPYFIETETQLFYSSQHTELMIEIHREFILTRHWSIALALKGQWASNKTVDQEIYNNWNYWQPEIQLSYRYNAHFSAFLQWQQERLLGDNRDAADLLAEPIEHEAITAGIKLMF